MQSVLFQGFEDFELIVQDNCSSPETWNVVRQFRNSKVKYDRSSTVLPMSVNWERALARCEGEYVFFMGDDDAIMPDGMRLASEILTIEPFELLSWDKFIYWWDNCLEPVNRNRLIVHIGSEFKILNARELLKGFFDWRIGFGDRDLPSIYTSFVRRDVVERVRALTGGTYFTTSIPDVWSGMMNCLGASNVGHFRRGLSLSGNSGPSTGCAYFFRSLGAERREDFFAEEGKTLDQLMHPSLIPSVNLEILMADQQYRAKELLFPDDTSLVVNISAVIAKMIATLNRDPASYDDTLAEVRSLAHKHSLDISKLQIPSKSTGSRGDPQQGLVFGPDQKVSKLVINCSEAGVRDVHQAAQLTAAVLPKLSFNQPATA